MAEQDKFYVITTEGVTELASGPAPELTINLYFPADSVERPPGGEESHP